MAMLYLTPVLPLGLVSYMCGTTAMDLYSFAVAKIASLPIYLMYTFMGASAHSIIKGKKNVSLTDEASKLEENQYMIVAGLVLSVVMISLITRKIKMELMKVRDGSYYLKLSSTRHQLQIMDVGCEIHATNVMMHRCLIHFLYFPFQKHFFRFWISKRKKRWMDFQLLWLITMMQKKRP